ncbi:L-Ala-D/L-Glu epimerase / N-acetyl-D-glutamate racemase [Sphingomonas sp. F9_3S_D5_B_2]
MATTTRHTLQVERASCAFAAPFRISGYVFEAMPAVVATISAAGASGRGEAEGVYYLHDDQDHMVTEVEKVRDAVEGGATRNELKSLLPAGGARNALDCALWELEARTSGTPAWQLAGVSKPVAKVSTFTLPADDPARVEERLLDFHFASAIKLKLDGDIDADRERLAVVRRRRPDCWLMVDANQGFSSDKLDALEQILVEYDVSVLEQPVPRGEEASLAGWRPPFAVAADESILDLAELHERSSHFDMINIKLDKCGGLTEALAIARETIAMGKRLMVGNMGGSTIAMAPAFIVAQYCEVVDLDGPFGLAEDPLADRIYSDGKIFVDESIWGCGEAGV